MSISKNKHDELGNLYWVLSHLCNQECDHCYMSCSPQGQSLSKKQAVVVIENLPRKINHSIILSGGELLHPANRELLFFTCDALLSKFGRRQIAIQTNGLFLSQRVIKDCLAHGISHISIASNDHYHRDAQGKQNFGYNKELKKFFKSAGFIKLPVTDKLTHESVFMRNVAIRTISGKAPSVIQKPNYSIWGANSDMWLRGNWARGRALLNNDFVTDHRHNFCRLWSGGRAFLEAGAPHQEMAIQLSHLFPCCPTTRVSLGDLTEECFSEAMQRAERHRIFRAINRGRPFNGCHELGLSPADARQLLKEKGNICLMCDKILSRLDPETFPLSPFSIY